ncbi:hypothetical protein BGZ54_009965, partial [Gamsiella multidivaricata]
VAVQARSEPEFLVSGAHFFGKDTTIPSQHGVEIFRNPSNHPSAAASILHHSADRAGFRPRKKGIITDRAVYEKFVEATARFPGFSNYRKRVETLPVPGGVAKDNKELRKQILKAYRSEYNNAYAVSGLLMKLLPEKLDVEDEMEEQMWWLTYVIVNNDLDYRLSGELVSVEVLLTTNSAGKVRVVEQEATLTQHVFSVDREYLVKHAQQLGEKIETVDLERFLKDLSTNDSDDDDDDDDDDVDVNVGVDMQDTQGELGEWIKEVEGKGAACPRTHLYPVAQWRMQH